MSNVHLKEILHNSRNIVFFGGAGVSTESGIPDFRSAAGLFSSPFGEYSPEDVLSHRFFMEHPQEFYQFYKRKMLHPEAVPGIAHQALAALEAKGRLRAVITQNIDGLHQQAGSRKVMELHGSVQRNYCMDCGRFYPVGFMLDLPCKLPKCEDCGGLIKPDVVLYGESLDIDLLQKAQQSIEQAEVLIVAGTSLRVQPAAGLVRCYSGKKLIMINKTDTPMDAAADLVLRDSIGSVLSQVLD